MASLKSLMSYLIVHYPYSEEISNARLTKMIYLADWKAALSLDRQITNIQWVYDNYGPYVPDVLNVARTDTDTFSIEQTFNQYGTSKTLISLKKSDEMTDLTASDVVVADHVIDKTKEKNFSEFIRLVYSTYPIVRSDQFSKLDLVELAREYRETIKK